MKMIQTYLLDVFKKHYIDFSGRANLKQFWLFVLFLWIAGIILSILAAVLGAIGGIIAGLAGLAALLPSLAISVRRLHDIKKSGWWLLISLVPVIGIIILLIFFILPTKR